MYSNNKEYRQAIRKFFNMNVDNIQKEISQYNYDDETQDELLFDDIAIGSGILNIIEKTKENKLFDDLYCLASALMISTNKETGVCILLSYDYFSDFLNVWNEFIENPTEFSENNISFVLLKNRLGKR